MTKTYEKEFRKKIGFTNASLTKSFFKATDCVIINWEKIGFLNERLRSIFTSIHNCVHESIRVDDIDVFLEKNISEAYEIMKTNDIFKRLNNNGRSPEDVYYSWMRGYCVAHYFTKALSLMLNVNENTAIKMIGSDQLSDIKTFKRRPTADIEVTMPDMSKIRLEIQSGYTGVNDIKRHKVEEAKRVFNKDKIVSYIVHFDFFNGKVAVVNLLNGSEGEIIYVKNDSMEGQPVYSIPPEAFKYNLTEAPPAFKDIVYYIH